ncbi:MAG: formylglycine-generating enzyme family protein, partial [Planctomycetaceae bacterium]|nr:formylglycine-generating enzyme family protein [Planctomycetaceae bacterium]
MTGGQLQAVVMVRDDFAMAAARFMDAIDIPILQGHNFATVDLFDTEHAEKVLLRFGQAFGRLPANSGTLADDQQAFVQSVASGLAQDGKVVSVRLALFAEMVKGKPWTPATLQEVGGTAGIGVNFLEETFSSRTANPKHRLRQQAARDVLQALLPEVGTDIKGHMRSHAELLEASGDQQRPAEFDDLLKMLDGELRLITPTDPEGDSVSDSSRDSSLATRYYQLTHDYLVPSLREWLTRKQQETRRGRAELKLAERSALWHAKPENRHLPSLAEWLRIRTLTDNGKWTPPQQIMMQKAGRRHLVRTGSLLAIFLAVSLTFQFLLVRQRAASLVESLKTASPEQITALVRQADESLYSLTALLQPLLGKAAAPDAGPADRAAALPARLVLVGRDSTQVRPLSDSLLNGELAWVAPIRTRLSRYADDLRPEWIEVLHSTQEPAGRRFRAALGLAGLDGERSRTDWGEADLQFAAEQLTASFAEYQPQLRALLRPVKEKLLPSLDTLFDAETATEDQKINAAMALADYAGDEAELMARLLTRATARQTEILYPMVEQFRSGPVRDGLLALTKEQPDENLGQADRVRLGRRRANAAITLLRQGEREAYFDALRIKDDPESLSQFVSRCRKWGVTPVELIESLQRSAALRHSATGAARKIESRVMYGLLLALGSYAADQIPEESRDALFVRLLKLYEQDPSAAVHSASGWLLRHWGREAELEELDRQEVPYDPTGEREWFRLRLKLTEKSTGLTRIIHEGNLSRFLAHSLTFIVFPAGEYQIGSPEFAGGESDRQNDEVRRVVRISRPVALCDREVTWEMYDLFDGGKCRNSVQNQLGWALSGNDAAFALNWYDCVEFCRWLTTEVHGDDESRQCYADPGSLAKDGNGNPVYGELLPDRGGFRLPTESEWELGIRSGQRTAYAFGSDAGLLAEYGWFQENSARRPRGTAVKPPTIGGLFDGHGNLLEWTQDWYGNVDSGNVKVDPLGPSEGSDRVFRGGGWDYGAANCRTAARYACAPASRTAPSAFR